MLFYLHVGILVLLLGALRPGTEMAVLAIIAAASWMWLRRHSAFGFGRRALRRLTWHAGGTWTLHDGGGAMFEARLLGHSLVHERLLVLNFRLESGERRTRILLGDELEADLMRRLRARLHALRGSA